MNRPLAAQRALHSVGPLLLLALLPLAAALAACDGGGEAAGGAPPPAPPELSHGVLRVGSDIPFLPFASFPEGATTPAGIDVDVAQALGEELGVTADFQDLDVDSRIPSLEAGEVDAIISAMTITEARRQRIDFIPYFRGGTGILVPRGNPTGIRVDYHLCLHTVAVQDRTIQLDQLNALNTGLCAGDVKIHIKAFEQHSQAVAELLAGGADAVLADYPQALNDVVLSAGSVQVIDFQIHPVIYGIGVRRGSPELKQALTQALIAIMKDGTYDAIMKRWGARAGAWKQVAS
ncbi:MAG: ABC transporter substrate-binding protein [Dehalococcoidia bacterium]|nr:ABC transporter substrate-binding protein [Dehalococcoidia bacterium]